MKAEVGSVCLEFPGLASTLTTKIVKFKISDSGHSIILIDELIMECHCH